MNLAIVDENTILSHTHTLTQKAGENFDEFIWETNIEMRNMKGAHTAPNYTTNKMRFVSMRRVLYVDSVIAILSRLSLYGMHCIRLR